MPTFVVDSTDNHLCNMYPILHDGYPLTEPCWLLRWMDHLCIDYSTIGVNDATEDHWYPVTINFWNFDFDYLDHLPDAVKNKLSNKNIKILFLYREADDPWSIRSHIEKMCDVHGFSCDQIWLISGHSRANAVPNTKFFWYFDHDYWFRTRLSPSINVQTKRREKKITCLSRIHKSWREWFVFNLAKITEPTDVYLSYGNVPNSNGEDNEFWTENNPLVRGLHSPTRHITALTRPNDQWKSALPLVADSLTTGQHNDHSLIHGPFFQNSYWNVVLETMLDTQPGGGVFVTEKTLKPIRNGQSFLIVGCQHTLAFLQDRGYKTFANAIDERYDAVANVYDRWYAVFDITRSIARSKFDQLDILQQRCLPAILHNQEHFARDRMPEITALLHDLDSF